MDSRFPSPKVAAPCYTIRASKAVQFKAGGHADLRNVHIVVYGHEHDRYDQIYGNQFTYDPQTGDINAVGEVHIDLQGNAEGPQKPDQAPPDELKNPIHLLTHSLTFNQKTGIAHTDEVVEFRTTQANGSAKGAYYDSNSNELLLKSDVHIVTTGQHPAVITGSSGSHPEDAQAGHAGERSPRTARPDADCRQRHHAVRSRQQRAARGDGR